MGALRASPTNPAAVQWVLPFALPLPNLPPRSTASSPGLGGRPCLPDSREEEGKGTPGPCTGGPGPPTVSPGPVAAPEQADVGTPAGGRSSLAPEPAPGPRAGQSTAERARSSAHGGPGQPDQPETQPQPLLPEPGRAAQGAARRAGRAGRGRPPGTHPRRGCASRGRGPQSRGLMAGGGPGRRRPHIPPGRRRLQSDCETARGREGAGRGRALAAWPAG